MSIYIFKAKFLIFILAVFYVFFPVVIFAADAPTETGESPIMSPPNLAISIGDSGSAIFQPIQPCGDGFYCIGWIGQYVAAVYQYVIGIAGVLAVVMIMAGGFLWLTSAGSPDRVGKAKDFISSALLGLFLALFSYIMLNTLNPRLVSLDAIRVQRVQLTNATIYGPADYQQMSTALYDSEIESFCSQHCNQCIGPDGRSNCRLETMYDPQRPLTHPGSDATYYVCLAGNSSVGCVPRPDAVSIGEPSLPTDSLPGDVTPPLLDTDLPIGEVVAPVSGTGIAHNGNFGDSRPGGRQHNGVDYPMPAGSPVHSIADGVVSNVYYHDVGGYTIEIDHGSGVTTRYLHLESRGSVSAGDRVSRGQVIAGVGRTGNATGNVLHFEIRINGVPVDPTRYIH